MRGLVAELESHLERARAGGGEKAVERHHARGKLLARERVERLVDPGAAVPRARAAGRPRHVPRRGADGGDRDRDRPGRRAGVRRRRERCDREGRDLLPDDREEAPARAGDRGRRTGCRASTWSTPAAPSCRCRPRSSPTATTSAASSTTRRDVGRGHPPDRGRDGLLHRRRRLRPGDERRGGHRQRHRHDLPGRAAAREGGDGRGSDAPRNWAAPMSTRASAASSTTSPRTTTTRWHHPRDRRATGRPATEPWDVRRAGRARLRPGGALRHRPDDLRQPYDVREIIARIVDGSRVPRVQAALRRRRWYAASPI